MQFDKSIREQQLKHYLCTINTMETINKYFTGLSEKQQDLTQKGSELAKKIAAFKENPSPKTTLGDLLSDMDLYLDSRIWVLDANRQPLAFSQGGHSAAPAG